MAEDLPGVRIGRSACPHDCPSTCALEVEILGSNRIGRVHGAAANSYTAGVVCAKVARYAERIHHPDRVTRPLLRTGPKGSGQFREIGWDEALDRIADQFRTVAARHGSEAVWPYYYAGTMGLVQRDGINRLRHALRYSGQKTTICTGLVEPGWLAGTGRHAGPDPREMAKSDLIVMWGGNPVGTQVNVMTHIQRARKERGARLVVVDPYRTGTAAAADQHLALRPGTDGALACAIMHIAFRDGYADRVYMARYADDPAGLEAHLASRGPAWAEAITGLDADTIEAFARDYCRTDRAFIRVGYGFSRSRNGAHNVHAVSCLPTVTGKWLHEGGGAFWANRAIYGLDRSLIQGTPDPSVRVLDMSRIGPVLTGDRRDLGDGPPVHAMLVQSCNPALVAPDSGRVLAGFARDDLFVAVHDQFLTDTAKRADIVLPATMFLEHDDLYTAGGHSHGQVGLKLVEPPGECRSNHEVIEALAQRLGATGPGFGLTARDLVDATLARSGWPDSAALAEAGWLDRQGDFASSHFLGGFGHPDGRFRFRPDWAALGPSGADMPAWPDHFAAIDAADARRPFRMVTAPARQFLNSTFTETPSSRRREGRPTALLNAADLARLGVAEGELVVLGNDQGEVALHAKAADGQQLGVVVVESIWPHDAFVGGVGINLLTSADAGYPNGGAVFHDTAVWVRPWTP